MRGWNESVLCLCRSKENGGRDHLGEQLSNFPLGGEAFFPGNVFVPVVVNRVHHCLQSGGTVHVDHSVQSATCQTVRVGRLLARRARQRPAVRRVTGQLSVPQRRIIITLRTVISPMDLCRPICGSKNSAVCIVSRIKSRGSRDG